MPLFNAILQNVCNSLTCLHDIPEDVTLQHRRCERLTCRITNVIGCFLLMIIPMVCCGDQTLFSIRI